MKRITNTEEANFYFKKVNELIDDYIKNHKIKPSEIYHYINRNYKSFLEEVEMTDVENIKTVVDNVLDHRLNMQKDSVMKFESFSSVKENIEGPTAPSVEHEKVLADYFNTSIGHVELMNSVLHLFSVNDFGKKEFAIIYSNEEFIKMKDKMIDELLISTKEKVLSINEIDDSNIGFSLRFWVSEIIDEEKFVELCQSKLSLDKFSQMLKFKLIKEDIRIDLKNRDLVYKEELHGYHIWIVD